MTFAEIKAQVARYLGNLATNHPFYGDIPLWVNTAANNIIRARPQMFPELRTSWVLSLTVADVGRFEFDYPSEAVAITSMSIFRATGYNAALTEAVSRGHEIPFREYKEFRKLHREADQEGWPRFYSTAGRKIYLYPALNTDYLTDLEIFGYQHEPTLSVDTNSPVMQPWAHPIIVQEAVMIGAAELGWPEKEAMAEKRVRRLLSLENPTVMAAVHRNEPFELDEPLDQNNWSAY